jgi:hypothetical protein
MLNKDSLIFDIRAAAQVINGKVPKGTMNKAKVMLNAFGKLNIILLGVSIMVLVLVMAWGL